MPEETQPPKLEWHYGPTAADKDPGKMWCYACGGEVFSFKEGYVCLKCGLAEDHESEED